MIDVKDYCNINEEKFRHPWLFRSFSKENCEVQISFLFMEYQSSPKVKFVLWLYWKNNINTRNVIERKTGRNLGGYVLYQSPIEIMDHLFCVCPFFTLIWRAVCNLLGILQTHGIFEGLGMKWTSRNFQKPARHAALMLIGTFTWSY